MIAIYSIYIVYFVVIFLYKKSKKVSDITKSNFLANVLKYQKREEK